MSALNDQIVQGLSLPEHITARVKSFASDCISRFKFEA
jgi:hypothetical protein